MFSNFGDHFGILIMWRTTPIQSFKSMDQFGYLLQHLYLNKNSTTC